MNTQIAMPGVAITELCLIGILKIVPALVPTLFRALQEKIGLPGTDTADDTVDNMENIRQFSEAIAPYVSGERALPDPSEFDQLFQDHWARNIETGKELAIERPGDRVLVDAIATIYSDMGEEALDRPSMMYKTVEGFRRQIAMIIEAAAAQGMNIIAFLDGEDAINRTARTVYAPDVLKQRLREPIAFLASPQHLFSLFRPLSRREEFGATPAEIDAALAEQVAPVAAAIDRALTEAIDQTVTRIYAN
ncbi:MAG TPA: hypothetical protein VN495_01620 [Candidatus Paceibacterota bacterium]|nr:hypothetical protein [Candidatus Paceibacterota bacterium]